MAIQIKTFVALLCVFCVSRVFVCVSRVFSCVFLVFLECFSRFELEKQSICSVLITIWLIFASWDFGICLRALQRGQIHLTIAGKIKNIVLKNKNKQKKKKKKRKTSPCFKMITWRHKTVSFNHIFFSPRC